MVSNDKDNKALDQASPKRGRPKKTPPMRLKETFQMHGQEALTRLLQLMRQSDDARVTLAATQEILNRGYGRPSQAVEVTQNFHEDVIDQLRMVQDRTLTAARHAAEAAAVAEDDQRQSEILDVVQNDGATIIEMSAVSKG
jgi:hypothetical protein